MTNEEIIAEIQSLKAQAGTRRANDIIADCTPAMIVSLETGVILYATPALDELFGYLEGYLPGKNIEVMLPPRFHAIHRTHFENYRAKPSKRVMGTQGMQLRGQRKDGAEFKIEISLYPRMYEDRECVIAVVLGAKPTAGIDHDEHLGSGKISD